MLALRGAISAACTSSSRCWAAATSSSLLLPSLRQQVVECRRGRKFLKVAYVPKPKKLREYRFHWDKLHEMTGGKYTHKPLNVPRLGGRHPEHGLKVNQRIGGGVKFDYFMTDDHRVGPTDGSFYEERVLEIKQDPNRGPFICLVAGTRGKRWLEAVHGVEVGQIIRTSGYIPHTPVRPENGDAYPIGALPVNTKICLIEYFPGYGATLMRKGGGSHATVIKRQGDFVHIRLPNKREISIKKECMCTVGQLSNLDSNKVKLTCAADNRRKGIKPGTGLHHRKTGYQGRKIKPLPKLKVYEETFAAKPRKVRLTLTRRNLDAAFGTAKYSELPLGWNPTGA